MHLISQCQPLLVSANLEDTVGFYGKVFGFTVASYNNDANGRLIFVTLEQGAEIINFQRCSSDQKLCFKRDQADSIIIAGRSLVIPDIFMFSARFSELYRRIEEADVTIIHSSLEGGGELIIADNSRYYISITGVG
jgi:hypothetical protein